MYSKMEHQHCQRRQNIEQEDHFFSVPNDGVLSLYYEPKAHILSDKGFSRDVIRFNGRVWKSVEQLKLYLLALESNNHQQLDVLLNLDQFNERALPFQLNKVKRQLEGTLSPMLTADAHFWTPEERLLIELRLLQRKWQDISHFRDVCLRHYIPRFVVFCYASVHPIWGTGLAYWNVLPNQKLRDLEGRNMRGWLLTFVTGLNYHVKKQLEEFENISLHRAFCRAWYITHAFFHDQIYNPQSKWFSALYDTHLAKGAQTLLSVLEKYHQVILNPHFWLLPESGSFNPHVHGIKALVREWESSKHRLTHYTARDSPERSTATGTQNGEGCPMEDSKKNGSIPTSTHDNDTGNSKDQHEEHRSSSASPAGTARPQRRRRHSSCSSSNSDSSTSTSFSCCGNLGSDATPVLSSPNVSPERTSARLEEEKPWTVSGTTFENEFSKMDKRRNQTGQNRSFFFFQVRFLPNDQNLATSCQHLHHVQVTDIFFKCVIQQG